MHKYTLIILAVIFFPASLASYLMWWDRHRRYYMHYYRSPRLRALRDWANI